MGTYLWDKISHHGCSLHLTKGVSSGVELARPTVFFRAERHDGRSHSRNRSFLGDESRKRLPDAKVEPRVGIDQEQIQRDQLHRYLSPLRFIQKRLAIHWWSRRRRFRCGDVARGGADVAVSCGVQGMTAHYL